MARDAALTVFGGVSQGTRVPDRRSSSPAPIRHAPCTLPNIFVADPPLSSRRRDDVRSRRARPRPERTFYSAAIYRTDLRDDIQFIGAGSGAVNAGYFRTSAAPAARVSS